MSGVMAVKVRWKRHLGWGWAVYYGQNDWPSNSFWLVPGTFNSH